MAENASPIVSVVVPVYNMSKYLRACLDSICSQTLSEIEIVAVNDGSTDDSLQILREYAARDGRIRIIDKPNTGYGDSMNRGLAEARGTYIGIVEPDDYISTGMYEHYADVADKSGADIVKSNYFEHTGRRDIRLDLFEGLGIEYGKAFAPVENPLAITVRPSIWSGIYRRSFLIEQGIDFAPTPGASFQDTSFCHMCWIAAKRAVILREAYLHYRTDNEASSSNNEEKVFAVFEEFARSSGFLMGRGDDAVKAFGPVLGAVRYGNYVWNYNRIAPRFRPSFAERWSREMVELRDADLVDFDLLQRGIRDDAHLLMADASAFAARYAGGVPWQDFDYARTGRTSAGTFQPAKAFPEVGELSEHPAVSVIIPIYRVESYVRECIESLLAQTFTDFEAICIDDGTPDASASIARSAARGDARFRFLEQENAGQSAARNLGLAQARGDYLLFLDADDLYVTDALEKLHARAASEDLDYLDFTARTFYETARMRRVNNEDFYGQRTDIEGTMSGADLFVEYMRRDEYYCSECLHFFKRSLLERAGLQFAPGVIHEDELFSPLLLAHAERAAFLNEALYLRRMRDSSTMTTTRGLRNLDGILYVTSELEKWIRCHHAEYDREFTAAFAQRIAFVREIAASDAARVPADELAEYESGLEGDELVTFELIAHGGLAIREGAKRDLDYRHVRKVGHAVLSVPRAIKDRLQDARNRS